MLFNSSTVCPECHRRVRIEDVRLTPTFSCPYCHANIGASSNYKRTMTWSIGIVSALAPYLLGAKFWLILVLWLPIAIVLSFLWAYIGKYILPPRLVRSGEDDPVTLGLGPGEREQ